MEYAQLPEFHRFVLPDGCHWNSVRETTTNVGLAIEQALRGIEQANQEFLYGIFGDAQWSNKNKLSDRLLTDLIEHFSQYNLSNSNVDADLLGQAYEYLIKHFADLTNKKAGEFYRANFVAPLELNEKVQVSGVLDKLIRSGMWGWKRAKPLVGERGPRTLDFKTLQNRQLRACQNQCPPANPPNRVRRVFHPIAWFSETKIEVYDIGSISASMTYLNLYNSES